MNEDFIKRIKEISLKYQDSLQPAEILGEQSQVLSTGEVRADLVQNLWEFHLGSEGSLDDLVKNGRYIRVKEGIFSLAEVSPCNCRGASHLSFRIATS